MYYIYQAAERAAEHFQTRDPFRLLKGIGATIRYSYAFEADGLKGFSTIIGRVMFAVINGNLSEHERKIVAGHEAAHLILHKDEIMQSASKTMKDFDIYNNTGKLECQANYFLADFLVSDKDVIESVTDENNDYFSSCRELQIPPPLFAFKLHSMMWRDYHINSPVSLQSGFLGSNKDMW